MNDSLFRIQRNHVTAIALATALTMPGTAAFAESMDNVVTTRPDQTVDQQYGRESVYAFSRGSKPFIPDQTASKSTSFFENVKSYSADAWHKTTAFLAPKPGSVHNEPLRYGRAGGFVGADQIAYVNATTTMASQGNGSVKTGGTDTGYNASGSGPSPAARNESRSSLQPEAHNGRTMGDRFDNPNDMRGQDENGG